MAALRLVAFALALLATPLAAKPGAPLGAEDDRVRSDAVALCVGQLGGTEGADPGEVEALCGCAADRFVAERDAASPPPVVPAGMPSALGTQVLRCIPDLRPDASGALAAAAMRLPAPAPEPGAAAPDKPAAGDEAAAPSGPGLGDRFAALLGRLTSGSLPRWAWALVALAAFFLLRRLFRRPQRDDDLMGPPRPERYRNLPRY